MLGKHHPFMLTFSLFFFIAFTLLGIWQLSRGFEKQAQLSNRQALPAPLTSMRQLNERLAVAGTHTAPQFFVPVRLTGRFLPHSFLLDNSIYYDMQFTPDEVTPHCFLLGTCGPRSGPARVGYRIFTLFQPAEGLQSLLVERGWLPANISRSITPSVPLPVGEQMIDAVIMPETGERRILLADVIDADLTQQVVQTIQPGTLAAAFNLDIYPHPLILTAESPGSLAVFAPLTNFSYLSPARHFGYAIQWWLMALALAIAYLVFYRSSSQVQGPADK